MANLEQLRQLQQRAGKGDGNDNVAVSRFKTPAYR